MVLSACGREAPQRVDEAAGADPVARSEADAPAAPEPRAGDVGVDAATWRQALAHPGATLHEPAALEAVFGAEGATARFVDDEGLTGLGARLTERLAGVGAEALDPARYHPDDLARAEAAFAEARRVLEAVEAPETRALARAARARWELLLADGLARYARDMKRGNTATEERQAKRALAEPKAAAPADEGPGEGEHGGGTAPDGDDDDAPAGSGVAADPPVLRDRKAFIAERLADDLRSVTDGESLDALFEALVPAHPQYRPLRIALARYRDLAVRGGWPELKPGKVDGELATRLAQRLALEGFDVDPATTTLDEKLKAAIVRYQELHQLRATGKTDATFWKVLNIPVEKRIESIEKSLDRLRKSKVDEDVYFVAINLADFHLELWRNGVRTLRNRVVVGKPDGTKCDELTARLMLAFATPVQSSEMDRLVFAPYWNVTREIREKEYEHERGMDPLYYEKNGYEVVFPGRPDEYVRQLPGPGNALGFVKFLFPNPHSTYVHDTNMKHLFGEPVRAFSHGCMRLQNPLELAEALLTVDGQWDADRFAELQEKWRDLGARVKAYDPARWKRVTEDAAKLQTHVVLKDPVPVHVEYYTARVGEDGQVEFLTDIYGYDAGRWSKGAPKCVPESRAARSGLAGVLDRVAELEKQGAALEARLAAVVPRASSLDASPAQKSLARNVRDLSDFGTEYRNLAAHIRAQHGAIAGELEGQGGRWTKRLELQAVGLHRLVQGLELTLRKARKTCERAEAALGG